MLARPLRMPGLILMIMKKAIGKAAKEAMTIHSHRGTFAVQEGASASSSTATVKAITGLGSLRNGSVAFTCQK